MTISSISHSAFVSKPLQPIQNNYSSAQITPLTKQASSSDVTISPLANIASKYNVSNMTEKEMGEMSKSLFDSGLIGSLEFAVMSFPLNQMRTNAGIDVNNAEKINFLAQYNDSLSMAKHNNSSPQEIKTWENIVSVLDKLDSIRSS
jgi:hypothetical protein